MKSEDIFESLNNAWRALCKQYHGYPNEDMRNSLNLLSKIIRQAKRKYDDSNKEMQISIEEWIEWLKSEVEE